MSIIKSVTWSTSGMQHYAQKQRKTTNKISVKHLYCFLKYYYKVSINFLITAIHIYSWTPWTTFTLFQMWTELLHWTYLCNMVRCMSPVSGSRMWRHYELHAGFTSSWTLRKIIETFILKEIVTDLHCVFSFEKSKTSL